MKRPDPRKTTCVHDRACGACAFLGEPYGSQLERKRGRLEGVLRSALRISRGTVLPTLPSPEIAGYRNRAKMTISTDREGRSSLGYFQRGTREVVDAPECVVLVPELLDTTRRLRDLFNTSDRIPFNLRHIDLRCGSDPERQHLTLVVKSGEMPRLPIAAITSACPRVVGIGVNLNPAKTAQVIKGRIEPVFGEREVWVETAGLSLRVSPASFFQVNLGQLEAIHALMAEFLGAGEVLFDLFAGVGTHGLALRSSFDRVVCIEGVRASVADAKATVKAAGIGNVEVVASPVQRALKRLAGGRPDAVVLNPSAVGAEQRVLDAIIRSPAGKLAYLSCDPETLARDLAVLARGGFELDSVRAIDMMPQTRQIEALALLQRCR